MNTIWSSYIQSIGTLYTSRALRFADNFKERYKEAFAIADKSKILEIGCGPGALAESLSRWYPDSKIYGVDRDDNFVNFAREKVSGVEFFEGDATQLAFDDCSFDVTISNTVAEHIEPSKFYGEQYRVLKKNGVCLVLSSRRGINIPAPCISEETEFERDIWRRGEEYFRQAHAKYGVCEYPQNDLDSADNMLRIAPQVVKPSEVDELKRLVNERYDKRLQLYDCGIKQWDTNVNVTMVVRGEK